MTPRDALLQRQRALVEAIGVSHHLAQAPAELPAALAGIDAGRLSLLARLTHAKRLGKIAHVLPATIAALATDIPALFPLFARDHPMRSAHGVANALQFRRFLGRLQRHGRLQSAFVADLAACECALAIASLREPGPAHEPHHRRPPLFVRKARGVALLACRYDVQRLLADGTGEAPRRPVHLAFVPRADAMPRVFELDRAVFGWIRTMRTWQRPGTGNARAVLEQLESCGIVQFRDDT